MQNIALKKSDRLTQWTESCHKDEITKNFTHTHRTQ